MFEVAGIAAAAVGVLVLRLGWGRRAALVAMGWLFIAAGLTLLVREDGAWGVAIGATATMLAACALLGREAVVTPATRASPPLELASVKPRRLRLTELGRRGAVFLLVVPLGFAATQLLAFGAQAASRSAGWAEANSTALALMLQPIAWGLLATVQMLQSRTTRMIGPALACAGAGLFLWWLP